MVDPDYPYYVEAPDKMSLDSVKMPSTLPKDARPKTFKWVFGLYSGTLERSRTSDLPLRRRPLYPTELQAHILLLS